MSSAPPESGNAQFRCLPGSPVGAGGALGPRPACPSSGGTCLPSPLVSDWSGWWGCFTVARSLQCDNNGLNILMLRTHLFQILCSSSGLGFPDDGDGLRREALWVGGSGLFPCFPLRVPPCLFPPWPPPPPPLPALGPTSPLSLGSRPPGALSSAPPSLAPQPSARGRPMGC